MMKLNILNGDSTLYNFREAGLPGDVIIWREMLSEGPVISGRNYDAFFSMRSQWVTETLGHDRDEYESKVVTEFNRLAELANRPSTTEIILWFEFDLHCQVNLVFILNLLSAFGQAIKVSLICPADHPNHREFAGIGQLSPEEFKELPLQKVVLDERDLQIAAEAWNAYCSFDKREIRKFISRDHGQLVTLNRAFEAHLDRFPDETTGLSKLEQTISGIVRSGITRREEIYRAFWKSNLIYGMGDSQIDLYIQKLAERQLIPPISE